MGVAWNGRVGPLGEQGKPVKIQWMDCMLSVDGWSILKGSPNVANAQKFIAFAMLPEPQARLSMLIPYGHTNPKAAELIPAARRGYLPSAHLDEAFYFDIDWWGGENKDKATKAWIQWALQ
jgi:putative spermidine/putrescine transport system substrate-binding protein